MCRIKVLEHSYPKNHENTIVEGRRFVYSTLKWVLQKRLFFSRKLNVKSRELIKRDEQYYKLNDFRLYCILIDFFF